MASPSDICNLGLGHIQGAADVSSISPPDNTREAKLCAKFYPVARDTVVGAYNWGFATRRTLLASIGSPPDGWLYRYKAPNDYLKSISLYIAGSSEAALDYDEEGDDQEGTVILANVDAAYLKYIQRVTVSARFPPLVVTSISWLLASYLAGPLGKSVQDRNGALREFALNLAEAKTVDANNRKEGGNTQKPESYDPHKSRK